MSWARTVEIIGRGRITVVDDSGAVQRVQVTEPYLGAGGTDHRVLDKLPRLAEFGFTSNPPLESDVVTVRFGGRREMSVIVGTNHQPSRPKSLQAGDTAIYDVRGAIIKLTAAGIVVDGAGLPMTIQNVGTLTVKGDLHVTGDVLAQSDGSAISLTHHVHSNVQSGSSNTGQPVP